MHALQQHASRNVPSPRSHGVGGAGWTALQLGPDPHEQQVVSQQSERGASRGAGGEHVAWKKGAQALSRCLGLPSSQPRHAQGTISP